MCLSLFRVPEVTGRIVILAVSLLFSACTSADSGGGSFQRPGRMTRDAGGDEEKALSVRGYHVGREAISVFIVANTTLAAIREVTVYSKLNAIVAELGAEEGDSVRSGQLLTQLDDREIRNEFEQAKIAVDQARVSVQQAEVRAQLSAAEYERAVSLFDQKLTSQQEFDQAELASRTDSLAFEESKRQLEAAESRLEAARIQMDYTRIGAPIDGVITSRLVDVGDRVNVNEALFDIQEFPPLWARIYVPEKSLPRLSLGQHANIKVETFPDRQFEGRIKMISPTVDVSSGTVKVTIEVKRPGRLLRPGMFGTVLIATETHDDAIVIPKKAVLRERDTDYVFVIQPDGLVARQEIEIGFSEEDRVEVLGGLEEGQSIVTVGQETLNTGYKVVVQTWENGVPDSSAPAVAPAARQPSQQAARGRPAAGKGQMFERLMQDPEIRKKYEAKLAEDPDLATNPQKRRAFFREIFSQSRRVPASQ
jgi:RND family efflux transporter MFP subunit